MVIVVALFLLFFSVSILDYFVRRHLRLFHYERYKEIGLDERLYDDTSAATRSYDVFFKGKQYLLFKDIRLNRLVFLYLLFSRFSVFFFIIGFALLVGMHQDF